MCPYAQFDGPKWGDYHTARSKNLRDVDKGVDILPLLTWMEYFFNTFDLHYYRYFEFLLRTETHFEVFTIYHKIVNIIDY